MFDFEIARFLYRTSYLLEIVEASPYKSRAYFRAAMAVDGYGNYIEQLAQANQLRLLPNIGISIEKNIREIISTHNLVLLDNMQNDMPNTIYELIESPYLSEKLVKKMFANNIFSFHDLEEKFENASFSLPEKQKICSAISAYSKGYKYQYAHVKELAADLLNQLSGFNGVVGCAIAGDLRCSSELLDCGEIVCQITCSFETLVRKCKALKDFEYIGRSDNIIELLRFSIIFKVIIIDDIESYCRLEFIGLSSECGSNSSDIRLPLRQTNIASNDGVFSHIPLMVYGDLHMHTDWSDGIHSIEQMIEMARRNEYEYIAITDHSQSLKPYGMSEVDALSQIEYIRELNINSDVKILAGIEVDIKADGSLDYPDEILKKYDIVIAAIHSYFNQPALELYFRLEKALSNPYVDVLAHPMGRLLGKPGKITARRNELEIDIDTLIKLCMDNDVMLEVNCFPERFDLSIENAVKAIDAGIKITLGTDSHSAYHMNTIKYMTEIFERTAINREYILNTYHYEELKDILNKKKSRHLFENEVEVEIKDYNYYFGSNEDIKSGRIKVVGIDLTGSQEKASGFAVFSGNEVRTERILSNDEMIDEILKINPAVVSIDSPLSLPQGRCCARKDCECSRFGIMRHCELLLKHFGIGVYPCLIDSMVNLTSRGIELSESLRSKGINVIESYPGVAQDLLQIPRKRKGLNHLLKGLVNFGIRGIKDDISHDEADAITSALVGCFYLNDQYTALGNDSENYLIVPRLDNLNVKRKFIIGLTGKIACGKTTAAEYLRFKYGFGYFRYSQIISKLYNVTGRAELQKIGEIIAQNSKEQERLTEYILDNISDRLCYVIDGIRQPEDFKKLSDSLGTDFTLISITASVKKRFERYEKENNIHDFSEFTAIDNHKVESKIGYIAANADFEIKNDAGYKQFMEQIDNIVKKICTERG